MDADDRPWPAGAGAVLITDEQERAVDHGRLRRLAGHVLSDRGVPAGVQLSVALVDEDAMAALKREHLGQDAPTDVLAFPMDGPAPPRAGEGPALLGDVVLCPGVAAAQAAARGVPEADELDLLLVHGILHLLGHDHADEAERAAMFGLTDELLASSRRPAPVTGGHGAAP